jgi:hypothetical protein
MSEIRTLFASFQLEKLINLNENSMRALVMRESYGFSESVKKNYAKRLKKKLLFVLMMK